MLSREENELMCRVGPGTPMGNLMRQYWIPAITSDELPGADSPPMRLRLLGENLIAFRATSGKVGIVANACPHRGASLFFGRNEEEGLRCVYHGWKFDITGQCIDMPSEPAESNFKTKIRATAYPCSERNNIVWTYMGPRETPPPLPDHPGNLSPHYRVTKSVRVCSYMQALEGDIDTVHVPFLHRGADRFDEYPRGSQDYYGLRQKDGKIEVREHEAGTTYGLYRPAEEDTNCWRIGHYLLPFYTFNAPGILTQKTGGNAWVPIDDDHVMVWGIQERLQPDPYGKPAVGGLFNAPKIGKERPNLQPAQNFLPDTTDWIGKFRSAQTLQNDYLIDREAQKNLVSYSGIPNGAEPEDRGMQESMGDIYYRTHEHLGTSDSMIIITRRKLINAAKALRDKGVVPANVDQPGLFRMFSGGAIVPKDVSGLDYCDDILFGKPEAIKAVTGGAVK
jgi:phthalate 4,5-dioxygenase oxygenase subunit